MSIIKTFSTLCLLVLFTGPFKSLSAQNEPIDNIQLLQQLVLNEADSNVVIEYGEGWMEGYNVFYKCLINKTDSIALDEIKLLVINDQDTVLTKNYLKNSSDLTVDIPDNGISTILQVDTLLYSSAYLFELLVYDNNGVLIQEISYTENED